MIGREGLNWWWDLAPTLKWTWAKTYADFAPHWYVLPGRTQGMSIEDFLRVNELVRRYGVPGKFYRYVNLYLINPEGTHKIWCMWGDDPDDGKVHLINLARTDRTYGPQTFSETDQQRLEQLRMSGAGDQEVAPS